MSIEQILAQMQAIVDGADGRSLTDDEVSNYEKLEADLENARKDGEVRARQNAYNAPAPGLAPSAPAKADDGLEKAFENYLRTGKANADIADLKAGNGPWNAQEVGTDSEGGYTVPDGFRQKLVEVQKSFGGLAGEVEHISTSTGSTLEYPSLDDTSNEGSITAEEAAVADGADLTFGTVSLGSFKYTSAGAGTNLPLRVSVELVQDSAFDIEGLVSRSMGTRIARKQATDWAVGTGSGQPTGITNPSADDTLATHDTIVYQDLSDLEAMLDPAYEQNAKWVMNKASWVAVRDLTDSDGRPLVWDASTSLRGDVGKSILGYPVVIDQAMPDFDATSGKWAVLGDLREAYVIRHVRDFVLVVDPFSRAVNGQVQYLAWERADGNVQNSSAYVISANTAS